MNWDEATAMGAAAARMIEDLTSLFEALSEAGYLVTPPTWTSIEETDVRPGHTKRLVIMELDGRLQIAKVFEPEAVDGLLVQVGYKVPEGHTVVGSVRVRHEFDVDLGPGEGVEVPPDIGSGPHVVGPRWPTFVAVMDGLTCDACRRRHMMTRTEVKTRGFQGCNSPDGCRCVVTPVATPPRPNSNKAGG